MVCRQKEMNKRPVNHSYIPMKRKLPVQAIQSVECMPCQDPGVQQLHLNGNSFGFGADSGTKNIFWTTSGQDLDDQLCFSNKESRIQILGTFYIRVAPHPTKSEDADVAFNVTTLSQINLLHGPYCHRFLGH